VEAAVRAAVVDASVFRMRTTASLRGSPANPAGKARDVCSLAATACAAPGSACEETR